MQSNLIILGASVRAAAESAVRAGYRPWCADFFADQDLAHLCPAERFSPGKASLERLAQRLESLPNTPWFYTGGFENHPDFVDRISRRHPLWGISGQPLQRVRDPVRMAEALRSAGLNYLPVQRSNEGLARDGTWLRKPLRSSGGIGIAPYVQGPVFKSVQNKSLHTDSAAAPPWKGRVVGGSGASQLIAKPAGFPRMPDVLDIQYDHAASEPVYFQQRAPGDPFSALFIATPDETRLLGVTRQFEGMTSSPFLYRGNIGPVIIRDATRDQLLLVGQCLSQSFGLKGWFGVDYVADGSSVWPVEVNPRYTASIEIHELAWKQAFLPIHASAFGAKAVKLVMTSPPPNQHPERIVAKRVLYASQPIEVGDLDWRMVENRDLFSVREISDIPAPGSQFKAGDPVLTVMATGSNVADCESQLARRVERWSKRLNLA